MESASYNSLHYGEESLFGKVFGLQDPFYGPKLKKSKAISAAAVWYAINRIAGNVSQIPLNCHRRLERGSEKAINHPAYKLTKVRPNQFQTPSVWKQQFMVHLLLWGNARSYIYRIAGRPAELLPLLPDRTVSGMILGEKFHATLLDKHDRASLVEQMKADPEKVVMIPDRDVLHVPWLTVDGISGVDFVDIACNSLQSNLAMGDRARTMAQKGYAGSLMLQAPDGKLRAEPDAKRFLEFFREMHDGSENAGKTGLLRDGITAQVLANTANDAQLIQNRIFERQETALWFGLESILGDDNSVSYNSEEQKAIAFLTNTLAPFLVKIEEECNLKLLSERELQRDTHYFKFNTEALMRMDSATKAEFAVKMVGARVFNPNEIREKFDMNPYEGGDEYENPAISPGRAASSDSEDDSSDSSQRSQAAVASRVKHLIGVESQRVVACTKQKNFASALDKFYGKWQSTLAEVIEELGGNPDIAYEHCQQSHESLLELSGNVTQDGLEGAVSELVSKWDERANELVRRICND